MSRLRASLLALVIVLLTALPAAAQNNLGGINGPTQGSSVGQPFWIWGWAVSPGAPSGPGVDIVIVAGCPVANCPAPTGWGWATYGIARPDVAAAYNNTQYLNSGFQMVMSGLPAGVPHYVYVYSHSTVTDQWTTWVNQFTPTATPILTVESPTNLQAMTQPIQLAGWAIDGSAATGTGVSAVDIWSYPNPGSGTPPLYVGAATYGVARADVGAYYGSRFTNSGYSLWKAGLAAGEHLFTTYAYSTASQSWFAQTRTAYLDIATVALTIDRQGTGTGGVTGSNLTCAGGANTQAVPCSQGYAFNTSVTLTAVWPDRQHPFE